MNTCLADATAFFDNELDTLNYLSERMGSRELQNIAKAANDARYRISRGLSILLPWSYIHEDLKQVFELHVGGLASRSQGAIDNISYFLSITREQNDRKRVIRKYHFDYTPPSSRRRTPQPMFHLQLPGELPSEMDADGYVVKHLCPGLSEPRVLYFPMSLALTLHLAFSEFRGPDTEGIRKDGTWRNLIKRDESALWKPYMKACLGHIDHEELVFDEAYVS